MITREPASQPSGTDPADATLSTTCPACRRSNPARATFCDNCGEFLQWNTSGAQPVPVRDVHPVPEPRQSSTDAARDNLARILTDVRAGRALADRRNRPDLAAHLQRVDDQLRHQTYPAVVCGEFKVGKSTLINALLQRDICPVDADVITAVPTTVTWAESPTALISEQDGDGRRTAEQAIGFNELRAAISSASQQTQGIHRVVEVGIPHRMLRSGLSLVDVPGAGGLDSAEEVMTLSVLRSACGVIFVSDASQELTRPELEFLTEAARRCPRTVLVITKTDLHQDWRRIRDLDQHHLRRAGLDIPVLPVSSLLRMAARTQTDQDLNTESGYGALVQFLAEKVVSAGREEVRAAAKAELSYVAGQLRQEAAAERLVLTHPERSIEVVAELTEATRRTEQLTRSNATWQQLLSDGIQDLTADVEFDLADRLRNVIKNAEELVEQSDPKHTWTETETWLRRQIAIATVANRDLITVRTQELAADIAAEFNLEAQRAFAVTLPEQTDKFGDIALSPVSSFTSPGGSRIISYAVAARTGYAVAMMIGVAGSKVAGGIAAALLFPVAPALSIVLAAAIGTGIGGKLVDSEAKRQRSGRQQQAKIAARRWADDISLHLTKQVKEQLRTVQRQLRDEFQARAEQLHRSSLTALGAAERAGRPAIDEHRNRSRELPDEQSETDRNPADRREAQR